MRATFRLQNHIIAKHDMNVHLQTPRSRTDEHQNILAIDFERCICYFLNILLCNSQMVRIVCLFFKYLSMRALELPFLSYSIHHENKSV